MILALVNPAVLLALSIIVALVVIIGGAFVIKKLVLRVVPDHLKKRFPLLVMTIPVLALTAVVCAGLIGAIQVISKPLMEQQRQRRLKQKSEASGQVTGTQFIDSSGGKTFVDYNYSVDGKRTRGFVELNGDLRNAYPVGRNVRICYDPESVAYSYMLVNGDKCGLFP